MTQAQGSGGRRVRLYDGRQLDAVLDRMARQLLPLLPEAGGVVLLGVLRRGAPLADRLQHRLELLGVAQLWRHDLRVERYADDLTLLHPQTALSEADGAPALEGRAVVVVDDVLYQGHSLLRVLGHVVAQRPAIVRSAVLVDRGTARMPVRADVAGLRIDAAPCDVVECRVPPYEADFAVDLLIRRG